MLNPYRWKCFRCNF